MLGKRHELIPSARRLINSLRDMGYDFSAAVADVVDNSIEARASKILIDVRSDGDNSWVRIADDGHGMTGSQIREALRYGSTRDYDATHALGKFGLGLKTASMSQCQHLTVASRSDTAGSSVAAHSWDLAHISNTDRWEILDARRDEQRELWIKPLDDASGTVVLWRRLDRILGFRNPYGGMAKRRLESMCVELEQHLAMVFHRFLAGEGERRKIRIVINGKKLRPWDPFVRSELRTLSLDPIVLQFNHEGAEGEILIEPFVVPHQDEFSSVEAHAAAAGPLRWNRQQGFYIYRANRMIQSGGWSNLRTMDEHTKLARIALSFTPSLDEAFRINVAKMRVQLPRQLREQIEIAIAPAIKSAQHAYRNVNSKVTVLKSLARLADAQIGKDGSDSEAAVRPVPTSFVRQRRLEGGSGDRASRLWTIDEIMNVVKNVATPEEQSVVRSVLGRVLVAKNGSSALSGRAGPEVSQQGEALISKLLHSSGPMGEA